MRKVIDIDIDELTLLIAEACVGMKRPPGVGVDEALRQLEAANQTSLRSFERAAVVAVEYIAESINKVNPGQAVVEDRP